MIKLFSRKDPEFLFVFIYILAILNVNNTNVNKIYDNLDIKRCSPDRMATGEYLTHKEHSPATMLISPKHDSKLQVHKNIIETSSAKSQRLAKQRLKAFASSGKGGTISFGINKVN